MGSNAFYKPLGNDGICSDCENAFLRTEFRDYMKKNPEIPDSGNGTRPFRTVGPIEERVSKLMRQLRSLNADLGDGNNSCHEDDD